MELLDTLFFFFHTLLIAFVLVGWIWRWTRIVHMVVVLLIAASWFGLGICFGIGYCPCTDWHWEIRRSMGKTDLPVSYIKFLLDSLLGTDLARELVDQTTAFIFFAVFFISAILFHHDLKVKR